MLLRIRIIFIFVIKEIIVFRKVSRLFETIKRSGKVEWMRHVGRKEMGKRLNGTTYCANQFECLRRVALIMGVHSFFGKSSPHPAIYSNSSTDPNDYVWK